MKRVKVKHLIEAEMLNTIREIFASAKLKDGKYEELIIKLNKLQIRYGK